MHRDIKSSERKKGGLHGSLCVCIFTHRTVRMMVSGLGRERKLHFSSLVPTKKASATAVRFLFTHRLLLFPYALES